MLLTKPFFAFTNTSIDCYKKSGINSDYKYKERIALNKCVWYIAAGVALAVTTYGCINSSFSDLENYPRKFKWNCLDLCSVDNDVVNILEEKIARNLGDGWIDVDLSIAMDKMNETMFLKKLQHHNINDTLVDEIRTYSFNKTKYEIPFMKMKIEECSKKALTTADVLSFVYVMWGILLIGMIQAILDYHGCLKWFYPDIYPEIQTNRNVNNEEESAIEMIEVKSDDNTI